MNTLNLFSARLFAFLFLPLYFMSCGGANTTVTISTTQDTLPTAKNLEVAAASDSTKVIELPDGSKVTLNRGSSVNYPENMNTANERNVTLKGEAYFEVKKGSAKKFNVYAGNTKTIVVGTEFNLRENGEDVVLNVVEGEVEMVELTPAEDNKMAVKAGEQATYQKKTNKITKEKSKNNDFKNWMKDIGNFIKETTNELKNIFKK